jgi:TatD DNase family protein
VDLVDTHCHIHSSDYQLDPELVLESAEQADVNQLICVGTDLKDSRLAVEFTVTHHSCWASIGIHPHEAKEYIGKPGLLEQFSKLARDRKVVAIGECGLDYYYAHSPKEPQIQILKFQFELALEHNLPLIFHVREAFDDFWPIFDEYKGVRGVLHSFTDSLLNMEMALKRGLFIGVNGIATFTKSSEQLKVYKTVPLKNLLLETDAPYLTPIPYRGTICQPKHVRVTAEFLSNLREENLKQLSIATTANAQKLFRLEK